MKEVPPQRLIVGEIYKMKEKGIKTGFVIKITQNKINGEFRDIEGTLLDDEGTPIREYSIPGIIIDLEPGEEQEITHKFYEIEENPNGGRKTRRLAKKRKTRSKSRRRRV